ncbi:hypothetical protein J2S25_003151 [Mesobacillus stamsii]|uniref:Sigma factor G inhibitor Gin n=1 Tax=Mesobacillus stamsii TaxID=225347 RepID=A0ABU0FZF3_9BACI|nr:MULTISPECIES: sigma factor G inhibitor Gin [Mesobacillus]MDQ0414941.1 hypothetical protein [Mesobacillus stamsii]
MGSFLAKNQIRETCAICEQTKTAGIHLYTSFICTDCETIMIKTETSDPQYKYYVEKLRKVTRPGIYS